MADVVIDAAELRACVGKILGAVALAFDGTEPIDELAQSIVAAVIFEGYRGVIERPENKPFLEIAREMAARLEGGQMNQNQDAEDTGQEEESSL